MSPFEIHPLPHQVIMLEDLDREREVHGRFRNLVVAATGTGKTVVAGLDYARFATRHAGSHRPRLLFVAHRKEILQQSRRVFREILRWVTSGSCSSATPSRRPGTTCSPRSSPCRRHA